MILLASFTEIPPLSTEISRQVKYNRRTDSRTDDRNT